jgi:hypothetical protein
MHLLLLCEQGLGDSIQFIRYVPLLVEKGARVTVECQPKLLPLFQCLQSDKVTVISRGQPLPNFDMHARLMTLPHILGSTPDNLPNAVPYHHDVSAQKDKSKAISASGFSAKMYLMFKVAIANAVTFPVPIRYVQWGWSGSATSTIGGNWVFAASAAKTI